MGSCNQCDSQFEVLSQGYLRNYFDIMHDSAGFSNPPSPCFAIIDGNNFFVSCERVFDPSLNNKPVIVLSNNDGCAISRSNEAKLLGIPMGAPLHTFTHLIKPYDIKVFSSNFELYGDLSSRMMKTLQAFTSDIEIYSIDEAFLNLPPLSHKSTMIWQAPLSRRF